MTTDPNTLYESVSTAFSKLHSVAAELNAVSDELGKYVADIDVSLKKLNLGIAVWVKVSGWEGDQHRGDLSYWTEDLGYSKIGGKWGISLRRVDGDYRDPDGECVEEWLFNDAPRDLRLASIAKFPELLETLTLKAMKVIGEIQSQMEYLQTVAASISPEATLAGSPTRRIKLSDAGKSLPEVNLSRFALRDVGKVHPQESQKLGAKEIFGRPAKEAK
jgi:hypothetical protein